MTSCWRILSCIGRWSATCRVASLICLARIAYNFDLSSAKQWKWSVPPSNAFWIFLVVALDPHHSITSLLSRTSDWPRIQSISSHRLWHCDYNSQCSLELEPVTDGSTAAGAFARSANGSKRVWSTTKPVSWRTVCTWREHSLISLAQIATAPSRAESLFASFYSPSSRTLSNNESELATVAPSCVFGNLSGKNSRCRPASLDEHPLCL